MTNSSKQSYKNYHWNSFPGNDWSIDPIYTELYILKVDDLYNLEIAKFVFNWKSKKNAKLSLTTL